METSISILRILSDGRFHSGEMLAHTLGLSRTSIWKAIQTLEHEFKISVQAVKGRGYCLVQALELLDDERIRQAMDVQSLKLLANMEVHMMLDSTNRYLMETVEREVPGGHAVLAESQSAGRGRRGRSWVSPFGQNVYLSVLWRYNLAPAQIAGLSLAIAVAVARVLNKVSGVEAELKWPNDILWKGRKLCGILLEVRGESAGPCSVVAGVGLNVRMAEDVASEIDQPWVDLDSAASARVSRNTLVGAFLNEILQAMSEFAETGLQTFMSDWRTWDATHGKAVTLTFPESSVTGKARGIDEHGALLLEHDQNVHRYYAGEVSLRRVPAS